MKTLRGKFFVFILIPTILILSAKSLLSYLSAKNLLTDQMQRSAINHLEASAERLRASIGQIEAALEERLESPGFQPGMKILWDFRNASIATLSNERIQRLIDHNLRKQGARGGGMSAIVASRDLDFGIGRVYQAYADGLPWDTMVFRDLESALEWLGCGECGFQQ